MLYPLSYGSEVYRERSVPMPGDRFPVSGSEPRTRRMGQAFPRIKTGWGILPTLTGPAPGWYPCVRHGIPIQRAAAPCSTTAI